MTFDQPLPPPLERKLSIVLIVAWVVLCLAYLPFYVHSVPAHDIDFDAFYCGAQALADGHNPYLQEPLRSCEAPIFFRNIHTQKVIPAPLPAFAIAAFEPLTRLTPVPAQILWTLLICAALAYTVILLRRITRLGWAPLTLIVFAADGIMSLQLGQITPFCVIGVLLIADTLQQDRAWPVAVGMVLLCAEPQVAIPVALSLLIFGSARMRLATLLGGLVPVAISLMTVGLATAMTYALVAIPLHAFAELVNVNQLSLSALLFQAGVPSATALALGSASYVLLSIGGIIASPYLARRFNDRAFLVLLPAACTVCAGTFVHQQMYAMVIPFGLLALRYMPSRAIAAMIVVVAMPWSWTAWTFFLFPFVSLTAVLLSFYWLVRSRIHMAMVAVFTPLYCIAASLSYFLTTPHRPLSFDFRIDPNALVQYAWIAYERTEGPLGASIGMTITRILSNLCLLALLAGCTYAALRPRLGEIPGA